MKGLPGIITCLIFYFSAFNSSGQTYNTLWIPDTLSGTVFDLHLKDTTHQFFSAGPATPSMAVNGSWWGPTLFFNKGDTVHLNVMNELMDTTTLHWHGLHLPAMMDGGPHQTIPPMTTWSPYYKVMNNAATYWYHPHLHMMTEHQINMGLGGLIIIRDSIESSLALPRTYGIDDIPVVLSDRRFDSVTNEIVMSHFGDTMIVNGTLNPQYTVPAQIVRLRIVNAVAERYYNFGFSNNAAFRIIATDGGLLDAPVSQNRFVIAPGERVEILLNLNGMQGQSIDLVAYNNSLPGDLAGSSPGSGVFASALGGRQFNMLHLNIGTPTANPITAFPVSLTTNTFYADSSATQTRHITMSDAGVNCPPSMTGCAWLDSAFFDMSVINQTVILNTTEIWEIQNLSSFAHPFHIHNIQFYILDRNGIAPPAYERGWKDVLNVRSNVTARFITRFANYADSVMPYMYHCHNLFHEDAGMMGQFLVIDTTPAVQPPAVSFTASDSAICAGECIVFYGSAQTSIDSWSWDFENGSPSSDTLQQVTVCYTQPGIYNVSLTASNSAGSDVLSVPSLITVYPNPDVTIAADTSVCADGVPLPLNGSPLGGTYTGSGVSGSDFIPSAQGIYNISYTYADNNGCSGSDTVTITVNALPSVTLTADDSVCINDAAIVLNGLPSGGMYSGTGVSGNTFDPSAGPGVHSVYYIYTGANLCSNSDTATIFVNSLPAVSLTSDDSACVNDGLIMLNGLPLGGNYGGAGVTGNSFDPSSGAGMYSVYYIYTDANSCSNSDTNNIYVSPAPSVVITADDSVCINEGALTLSGAPAGGIYSGTAVTGNSFEPSLSGTGTFAVSYIYTDGNGCTDKDTAFITVSPLPSVVLTAPDSVCVKQGTALLSGSPAGGTFSGNGVTGNVFDPMITGIGYQAVFYSYTDAQSCTNTDTAYITVSPYPAVFLSAPDTICLQNGAVFLSGNPAGGTYSGTGVSGNMFDPAISGPGTFDIMYIYTDSNHCTGVDTTAIYVEVCTGLHNNEHALFSVHPNPATSTVFIDALIQEYDVALISADGRVLLAERSTGMKHVLSLSSYEAGIYLIRITAGTVITVYRVVKL